MDESVIWIDLINEKIHKGKWTFLPHLTAKSPHYPEALKAAKKAIKFGPFVLDVNIKGPGKSMHIFTDEKKCFLSLFKRFYRARDINQDKKRKIVRKFSKRSKDLFTTDIRLNDDFYSKHGMNLKRLSVKQQGEFELIKDLIHEEHFGKMERFNKMSHYWIPNNKLMIKKFVNDILVEYRYIVDKEYEDDMTNGRYYRMHILNEGLNKDKH